MQRETLAGAGGVPVPPSCPGWARSRPHGRGCGHLCTATHCHGGWARSPNSGSVPAVPPVGSFGFFFLFLKFFWPKSWITSPAGRFPVPNRLAGQVVTSLSSPCPARVRCRGAVGWERGTSTHTRAVDPPVASLVMHQPGLGDVAGIFWELRRGGCPHGARAGDGPAKPTTPSHPGRAAATGLIPAPSPSDLAPSPTGAVPQLRCSRR